MNYEEEEELEGQGFRIMEDDNDDDLLEPMEAMPDEFGLDEEDPDKDS